MRAALAAIDLDALDANLDRLREVARAKGLSGLRVVLKADAYGHGAVPVGRHLAARGVDRFAVALVEEGVELRRAGVSGDILVMGPCLPEQRPVVEAERLVPTVSSAAQLALWTAYEPAGSRLPVHVKVNTGMNRLGIPADDLPRVLSAIRGKARLELAGLMTHLADASHPESPQNRRQTRRFEELQEALEPDEHERIEIHLANSAALLHQERHGATVARPGLALLGYDPAGRESGLVPAMSVSARLVQIHALGAGERVGYGGRWRAPSACRVGIVPLGYADGYAWRLGDRAEALVGGRRVPVVGAVSMDMLAVELGSTEVEAGKEVVLLGRQGEASIDAAELAATAGTVTYEVLCGLGLRLPRLYVANGRPTSIVRRVASRERLDGAAAVPASERGRPTDRVPDP